MKVRWPPLLSTTIANSLSLTCPRFSPRLSLPRRRLQTVRLPDGKTLGQRSLRSYRHSRIRVVDGEFILSSRSLSSSTQLPRLFASNHHGQIALPGLKLIRTLSSNSQAKLNPSAEGENVNIGFSALLVRPSLSLSSLFAFPSSSRRLTSRVFFNFGTESMVPPEQTNARVRRRTRGERGEGPPLRLQAVRREGGSETEGWECSRVGMARVWAFVGESGQFRRGRQKRQRAALEADFFVVGPFLARAEEDHQGESCFPHFLFLPSSKQI